MATITDADREAWLRYEDYEEGTQFWQRLMTAPPDTLPAGVFAFARHREQARREALEEAAKACEGLSFFTEISELIGMTKQEMSERTCSEAAAAIRALIGETT